MRPSRGMGDMKASKMPKAKTIRRKDNPDEVTMYAKGGKVAVEIRGEVHLAARGDHGGVGQNPVRPRAGQGGSRCEDDLVVGRVERRAVGLEVELVGQVGS